MKWVMGIAAGVLLCLAAVLLFGGRGPEQVLGLGGAETASGKAPSAGVSIAEDNEVARINGRTVTAAEMKYAMGLQRTKVIEYFQSVYNLVYDGSFWEMEIGGENPLEMVKREALAAWTRSRILLEMGQEEGLVGSISFHSLLSEMEFENKLRAQAAASGKPVYGPVAMKAETFIPYYLSNLELALQEKLKGTAGHKAGGEPGHGEPAISNAAEGKLLFTRISIAYRGEGKSTGDSKQEAEELLAKVRKSLINGISPEEAVSGLKNDNASLLSLRLSREKLDSANVRVYFREQGELYAWLTGEREYGEISPVMDEGFLGEWVLAVLDHAGTPAPGTVKEQMKEAAAEDSGFEAELEQRVRAARVEMSEPGYSALQVQ